MKRCASKPYKNLLYAEYPQRNASRVNELALRNVTSDEVKKNMAQKINEQIKSEVDEYTANMHPAVKLSLEKTIEKLVEEVVNRSVDGFIQRKSKRDRKAST